MISDIQLDIKAESTYLNPAVKSKQQLVDWVLGMLGSPLITVELTNEQIDLCIQNALEKYTKYAWFPTKDLIINLNEYVPGHGFDLSAFNVGCIHDISFQRDSVLGMGIGSDVFFGMPAFLQGQGGYPFFGNNGTFCGAWTTYHNLNEFFDLTKRMTGSNPQWRYDKSTKVLTISPEPRKKDSMNHYALLQAECEPPLEELYGNEYVKRLVLAYSKILLGTVRKKFQNVPLPGGGTVDIEIGQEGREELEKLVDEIKLAESRSQFCFVG